MLCKGYVEANSKFLKLYDTNKPTSYMIFLDANNLYGHTMVQLHPTEILYWDNPNDFNIDNYFKDSPKVCFTEVDLDFPDQLHNLHNHYCYAGEKMELMEKMLLEYQLQIIEDNNFSVGKK